MFYHEGVFGEEVPTGYSGCPSWCVWVRRGWPSAEPAADCPDYEDSVESEQKKDTVASWQKQKYLIVYYMHGFVHKIYQ